MIPEWIMLIIFAYTLKNSAKNSRGKQSATATGLFILFAIMCWGDFFNDTINFFWRLITSVGY